MFLKFDVYKFPLIKLLRAKKANAHTAGGLYNLKRNPSDKTEVECVLY